MEEPRQRLHSAKGIRAKIHDERIRDLQERAKPKLVNNGGVKGDPEVVPGFQLSEVLRRWVTLWLAEKPLGFGFMGPLDYLSEKSDIHIRRVQDIVNGKFDFVPLGQADLLLTACGKENLLYDEIMVVPNPRWTTEQWLEWQGESGCVQG